MNDNSPAAANAAAGTIEVGGQVIKVKFGVHFPELNQKFTREELLQDAEAVADLLEKKSGAVEIVKQEVR